MASLQLTFSDLYSKVLEYLGDSSNPATTDTTRAKALVNDGYRRFLEAHDWSWLFGTVQITLQSGANELLLPEDFERMKGGLAYKGTVYRIPPVKKDVTYVRGLISSHSRTDYPEVYGVYSGTYSARAGMRKSMIFWPTADQAYNFYMEYRFFPEKLVLDAHIPVGGPALSGVIQQCALAEAEKFVDEVAGTQEADAGTKLAQAIVNDVPSAPDTIGSNEDTSDALVVRDSPRTLGGVTYDNT